MKLFEDLHRQGHTLIVVTHDDAIAAHARREVRLRDGRVESDRRTSKAEEK
jgi:ABC-type lipoprotein export system ATPase subunit